TVEVNVTGAFVVAQLAARVMADEGGGVIVLLTWETAQAGAVFAATQAALTGLAGALDAELGGLGVRVRAVPVAGPEDTAAQVLGVIREGLQGRSEERRVGKEGRARWAAYQEEKKSTTESRARTPQTTHRQ